MAQAVEDGVVLESLDAEHLEEDRRLSETFFSKIIFMFPHVGGKMKIDRNRRLLLNIIRSSRKVLSGDGEIIITLCKGEDISQFITLYNTLITF